MKVSELAGGITAVVVGLPCIALGLLAALVFNVGAIAVEGVALGFEAARYDG